MCETMGRLYYLFGISESRIKKNQYGVKQEGESLFIFTIITKMN